MMHRTVLLGIAAVVTFIVAWTVGSFTAEEAFIRLWWYLGGIFACLLWDRFAR